MSLLKANFHYNNKASRIFVISDSVGETANRLIQAALAQYPNLAPAEIKNFPFIDNESDLKGILQDALTENAIVASTLVNPQLNRIIEEFATTKHLRHIDFLSQMIKLIQDQTGVEPILRSGALHALDEGYFDRVAAIEFAVKYDDGKNPKGFLKSDLVLLGISRTSKTPLSMYLANKSYKVSNLPLIPEVNLPQEIYQVPAGKIVGLTASPNYIMKIRAERVKLMGVNSTTTYNDLERIRAELSYAEELYARLGALVVSVENKSIEEVAQIIEQQLI
ncbi:pyruvate, water dikinase regulatory protein [Fundicoccus ignavus]|uniref:Putative pyruvate, phosphate dikinase regulatory protein n=1 Tax=Fundicoccus ignavus TaxID=2664442 RepID=A0A6I2GGG3_9LACT|nr:pyruvate, water dikinase regulatory protein [Fundicoccus ignavus]MRI81243.1 pyruvate, phosphate dikinase/phosphoenolpyruvate synthase regulator [Fundicoccus ignavus]MRI86236.1 pyruvate, phosphate dikinase/phosphoenolpyruvate synthase regulator [Fundicoccus ignavus]MRJ46245.1 pyruvate, phosphate dikinase/phosphoenolpyruvate synthase regulator [Fundicoccus ignavus]